MMEIWKDGRLESRIKGREGNIWNNGVFGEWLRYFGTLLSSKGKKWWRMQRKNINRGYQGLFVWQDAKELYKLTCEIIKVFPFDYKKVVANQIGSVDSIQRNIAEGYCRKSINEYLQFLNIALGSLGESVSSMRVYKDANQLKETDFETWDQLAFKLENGLIKLIKSLQEKKKTGDWEDSFVKQ